MAYKIAVISQDGKTTDTSFGSSNEFLIYNIDEEKIEFIETRIWDTEFASNCGENKSQCKCGGNNIPPHIKAKIEVLKDCRCLICKKIGDNADRHLQRSAITVFAIEGEVEEIIKKIVNYYEKMDNHISLRNLRRENVGGK